MTKTGINPTVCDTQDILYYDIYLSYLWNDPQLQGWMPITLDHSDDWHMSDFCVGLYDTSTQGVLLLE